MFRTGVKLELGQVSGAVAMAANVTALETATSDIGAVVNNQAILNLPLDTRNAFSLIYLTPGRNCSRKYCGESSDIPANHDGGLCFAR